MKKLLPIVLAASMVFSFVHAEELTQQIEDLELNLDLQRIIIDNADSQGKDVSMLRLLLSEYEEEIQNLKDTYNQEGEGLETQKAQNAVWSKLAEISDEYERQGINVDGDNSEDKAKEAKTKVEEAIDGLELHFEVLDTLIEAAELQGKDVSDARKSVRKLKDLYDGMVKLYDGGEYENAQRELFKIYIEASKLQKKLDELGINGEEDTRPVKERVEEVVTKFEYPLQVMDILLDNTESEGKDVSVARDTVDDMRDILSQARDLYDNGEYDKAWSKVMRLFVLGVRLQNDMKEIGINLEDGRTSQEKVKEAIDGFEVHEESIRFVFTQAVKKGRDISKANNLFEEMKSLMNRVEGLYSEEKYEEAEQVLFQVYIKAPQFQEEFQKLVKSLEDTPEEMRAKLKKTLDEYDSNLPLIHQFIEAAKNQGKDTEKVEKILKEFESHMDDVKGAFDSEDYKEANRHLQRAYIVANEFKKEFEKLNQVDKDEIRSNIDKAKEGIGFARDIIHELKRAGLHTDEAESLISKIEKRMKRVEELYNEGKYKEASQELMKAFSLGSKLQAISNELIKEYKGG